MLTAEEKKEIDEAIHVVPYKQAACIEALKGVQNHRRWVSDESLKDIAAYMEMTAEELDSVATFYNLIFRKPVGRHIILVCDSISCWVMGYESLRDELTKLIGIKEPMMHRQKQKLLRKRQRKKLPAIKSRRQNLLIN